MSEQALVAAMGEQKALRDRNRIEKDSRILKLLADGMRPFEIMTRLRCSLSLVRNAQRRAGQ